MFKVLGLTASAALSLVTSANSAWQKEQPPKMNIQLDLTEVQQPQPAPPQPAPFSCEACGMG